MAKTEKSKAKSSSSKGRGIKRKRGKDDASTAAAPRRPQQHQTSKKSKEEEGVSCPREAWSKSKKKRMRTLLAKQKKHGVNQEKGFDDSRKKQKESATHPHGKIKRSLKDTDDDNNNNNRKQSALSLSSSSSLLSPSSSSSLQQAFKARLSGSRFRVLNEELYTSTSSSSFERFQTDPTLFEEYHQGFRHQVENWPVNPVDVIVASLKSLATTAASEKNNRIVVADFGCGDAQLAQQLLQIEIKNNNNKKKKCPFHVYSFDLVAASDLVTACDMANVPLEDAVVDVAIFCLSLMGTNLADFVREAHRVLKQTGKLKIAEVRSRFETPSRSGGGGKKDELLKEFIDVLDQLGFKCTKTDRSNKMFLLLDLEKNGKVPKKDLEFTAKPCIYKRR